MRHAKAPIICDFLNWENALRVNANMPEIQVKHANWIECKPEVPYSKKILDLSKARKKVFGG